MKRPLLLAAIVLAACSEAPAPPTAEAPRGVDEAIRRGVAYLVASQNKDGSWGTPASNLYDIYAPVPGSYHAFQVASTGLAVQALAACGDGQPGAADTLRRATDFLVANHTRARRVSPDTIYNTWAHAYALEAFADLLAKEKDETRRAALRKAAGEAVDLLRRFEFVDGGWGYYDFYAQTRNPSKGATSFTTAACLVALRKAKDQGIDVPQRLVDRAVTLVERCRGPGGAFTYDFDLRFHPRMGVNKPKGALARTPACLLALDMWGRKCPDAASKGALDELLKEGHFLQIARKYPQPHESWYQNSGYFCFYGYRYAAELTAIAPAADRARWRGAIASYLVSTQEKDGSFWDYQLYGYHKAYGTGYVLLALSMCGGQPSATHRN